MGGKDREVIVTAGVLWVQMIVTAGTVWVQMIVHVTAGTVWVQVIVTAGNETFTSANFSQLARVLVLADAGELS